MGGESSGVRTHLRTPYVCRAPQLDFGFVALQLRLREVDEQTGSNGHSERDKVLCSGSLMAVVYKRT
jgi:hypothetical protein